MKDLFKFKHFWIRNNISFLTRYWLTATAALEGVNADPESFEEFQITGTDPRYVETILSSHKQHHCYSGVLITYATLDEFLAVLAKDVGRLHNIRIAPSDLKDRGVRQYKKYIHDVCPVDPNDLNIDWTFLHDFSLVRNSIIHANGNKLLLNTSEKLDAVVAKYPGELSFKHEAKLVVEDEFVARCIAKTSESATRINRYLHDKS